MVHSSVRLKEGIDVVDDFVHLVEVAVPKPQGIRQQTGVLQCSISSMGNQATADVEYDSNC